MTKLSDLKVQMQNIRELLSYLNSNLLNLDSFLGQMIYMDNWRMLMYLGTPVMPDLNALIATGLYINDLSMHDFSRSVN